MVITVNSGQSDLCSSRSVSAEAKDNQSTGNNYLPRARAGLVGVVWLWEGASSLDLRTGWLGGASHSGALASGRSQQGHDFLARIGAYFLSPLAFPPQRPAHPKAPLPTTRIRSYFSISFLSYASGIPVRRVRGPSHPGAPPPGCKTFAGRSRRNGGVGRAWRFSLTVNPT